MSPCPQCGAIPQTSDKFCNVCGFSLGPSPFGAPQGGGFGGGQPPQYGSQPGFGAPQQGGGIPPIDSMPFTNDAYGNAQQGGGFAQSGGYPAGGAGGFGQPQGGGGFGQQPQGGGGGGFGGFGQQPQGGGGFQDQTAQPNYGGGGGFGQQPQGGGFGGGGFGQQPPQQQGFGNYPQPGAPPGGGGGFGGGGVEPQPQANPYAQPQAPAPAAASPQVPAYQPPPPQALPATALRGFVLSYQANPAGEFWPLTGGRKVIGRANSGEQVDVPLADATTSSRHAALTVDGTTGTITLEDTGSTNGTFVNEEHIGFNGRRELKDGDKLRFGGYVAFVKIITRTH